MSGIPNPFLNLQPTWKSSKIRVDWSCTFCSSETAGSSQQPLQPLRWRRRRQQQQHQHYWQRPLSHQVMCSITYVLLLLGPIEGVHDSGTLPSGTHGNNSVHKALIVKIQSCDDSVYLVYCQFGLISTAFALLWLYELSFFLLRYYSSCE